MSHETGSCLGRTPQERWETLKARGHYTVEETDAIDKDTPWSDLGEPAWWLEMMEARRVLRGAHALLRR